MLTDLLVLILPVAALPPLLLNRPQDLAQGERVLGAALIWQAYLTYVSQMRGLLERELWLK